MAFGSSSIFAAETLSEEEVVMSEIDMAFETESSEMLAMVLSEYRKSPHYEAYETYALAKTRELIVDDKLQLAMETSLVLVDHNLQNFEAVDLYSSIYKAVNEAELARQKQRLTTAWTR